MEEVVENNNQLQTQKTLAVPKERNSSLELMRIIGIIFILISHLSPYFDSSLTSYIDLSQSYSFSYIWILQFFHILGQLGNCLFLLPMGYFMVKSKINVKKVFLLVGETWFYAWAMLIIFLIFDRDVLATTNILRSIFPIMLRANWFISCYLLVYLLSPLLNAALKHTKKEITGLILCFLFVLYSVTCVLYKDLHYYNNLVGMLFAYLIGGYIGLYNPKIFNNKKVSIITLCLSFATILIFIVAVNLVGLKVSIVNGNIFAINYFVSFPVLLTGLSIFSLFKNANIKSNKFINKLASCSLGVYLLTDNILIRSYGLPLLFQWIYEKLGGWSWYIIPIILALVVVCFACVVVIDLLRKISVEKLYSMIIDKLMPTFTKFGSWVKGLCSKLLS